MAIQQLSGGATADSADAGVAILRIANAPKVEAYFIQSDFTPTGVGEPALPPVAPAIANAIFAATGQRVRSMPFTQEGYTV